MSCTTILAGPAATESGSLFISRNEDCSPDDAKRLIWHPAKENAPGAIFRAFRNDFTWPLPPRSLGYQSVSDSATDGASEGEAGFNEKGVGLTATETIYASRKALAIDPYLPLTGVIEDMIEDAVLPHIASAREGVLLLGKMVEKAGAGEGCGVAFMDANEIWWFETCSGHQWAAARLPEDACYVTANHARLQEIDPEDSERFLASPDLITFAEKNGLWEAGKRPFNVRLAYCEDKPADLYYNFPRNRVLLEKYQPEKALRAEDDRDFPVFFKPARKLSLLDIASGLRNRFEGTDSDPYATGNPHVKARPISVFRCTHTHILEVHPDLPREAGSILWVSWGMPSLGVFVPVFLGSKSIPEAYGTGTHDADSVSAAWAFRKVQTLAMLDYAKLEPVVRRAWDAWEEEAQHRVALIQARYRDLLAQDAQDDQNQNERAARDYLEAEGRKILEDAVVRARALENELMTLLTRTVSMRFPFNGA